MGELKLALACIVVLRCASLALVHDLLIVIGILSLQGLVVDCCLSVTHAQGPAVPLLLLSTLR